MARPGLQNHPKFRRLVHLLKEPVPHAVGYLECMWEVAYEHGNPFLGSALDVELAAQWPGEPGRLTRALAACGLIDVVGGEESNINQPALIQEAVTDISYQVHDLFDHAPDYVLDRSKREQERKKTKICDYCGDTYRSKDCRSKFCSDACRQANHRNGSSRTVTDGNGANVNVTQRNTTPAPAPAPAPAPLIITPIAPASATTPRIDGVSPPAIRDDEDDFLGDFSRGWNAAKAKLSSLGASRWKEAVDDAKANGCTPGHVMELLAFAEKNSLPPGAMVYRVSRASMTLPVSEGWPPKPPDQAAASARKRNQESAEDQSYREHEERSKAAADERERRFGPELDAMDPAEIAEICKPNAPMAKLLRKGEKSPLLRAWLLQQLERRVTS